MVNSDRDKIGDKINIICQMNMLNHTTLVNLINVLTAVLLRQPLRPDQILFLVAPSDYTSLLEYHRSHDPYGAMILDSFPFTSGPPS